MSSTPVRNAQPNVDRLFGSRFGNTLSRGFRGFFEQWQNWLVISLVAAGISIAALLLCFFPAILVAGPLSCGLHYCALQGLRGQSISAGELKRGWLFAGRSMIAEIVLQILQLIPVLFLYVLFGGIYMALFMGAMIPLQGSRRGGIAPAPPQAKTEVQSTPRAEPQADEQMPDPDHEADGADVPAEEPLDKPVAEADSPKGPVTGGGVGPGPGAAPSPAALVQFVVTILAAYGFLFLGVIAAAVVTLWFSTKTMFVMPLIADRGLSCMEALELSWQMTKPRFWELLFIQFLASIISSLGTYLCYIGLVATVPLYFTMVAAAYESERAIRAAEALDAPLG